MPKVKDKGQKRKFNSDAENHSGENHVISQKVTNLEGIAKSKQLEAKVKKRDSSYSLIEEPIMCGKKIPMPSLADLEKMFEDSDDDVLKPTVQNHHKEVLLSSNCSKTSENEIVDTITHSEQLSDPEMNVQPLVTKRKRKINKTNSSFNKDPVRLDENEMQCIENRIPTKKKKECGNNSLNPCDNNDLSVIIPDMPTENADSIGSGDSNKTVEYDYHNVSPNYQCRPFSPLPSTSKNNEIFLKNELLFNQSLMSMSKSDVEIIEMPCETIILDDDDDVVLCSNVNNNVPVNNSINEVINVPDEDDFMYSTDYMKTFDEDKVDSDCEIIDIDSLIAENKAILDNYKRKIECIEVKPKVENQVEIVEEVVVEPKENADRVENNKEPSRLSNGNPVYVTLENLTNTLLSFMLPTHMRTLTSNTPPANQQSSLDDSVVLVSAHGLHPAPQRPACDDQVIILSPPPAPPNNVHNIRPITQHCTNNNPGKQNETSVPITNIQTYVNNVQANIPVKSIGDCPICMENLSNNTVASTICGHVFCMKCIKAAIQASGKRCPTCRKVLKGNGFHQLFL